MGDKILEDLFSSNCSFRIGNGFTNSFWHSAWLNGAILKEEFKGLFVVSILQDAYIASMGGWRDGLWCWNCFRTPSAAMSIYVELDRLLLILIGSSPAAEGLDSPKWRMTDDRSFTVSSCYTGLSCRYIPFGPVDRFDNVFSFIWKLDVPLKARVFGWRCFHDRTPSKELLVSRRISPPSFNENCVFCDTCTESSSHLLLHYQAVRLFWKDMAEWLDFDFCLVKDFKESISIWRRLCVLKNINRRKAGSVWLVIIWSVWLCRNSIIFNNYVWNVSDIVWSCNALIWRWSFIGKIMRSNYNFYEFSKNSLLYLDYVIFGNVIFFSFGLYCYLPLYCCIVAENFGFVLLVSCFIKKKV